MGLGFWVLDFEFWVSVFGFLVLAFVFFSLYWVFGFWGLLGFLQVKGFRIPQTHVQCNRTGDHEHELLKSTCLSFRGLGFIKTLDTDPFEDMCI